MIRAYWWKKIVNVGDALSPLLIEFLSGRRVRWSCARHEPVMTAIGSIMHRVVPGWTVWGSGMISPDSAIPQQANVLAVRGPLTRKRLAAHGYPPDVPIGDPGLLAPLLFSPPARPRYEWGIIPHFMDYALVWLKLCRPAARQLPGCDGRDGRGILLINPRLAPKDYFRQLTRCRRIATSSLHGLIFADAFGIPNVWFMPDDNQLIRLGRRLTTFVHDPFKYYDYLAGVGRPMREPVLVKRQFPWELMEERAAAWQPIHWDPRPLLEAFPYKQPGWDGIVDAAVRHYDATAVASRLEACDPVGGQT
jgi:pyruvyltransferase